MGKETVGTSADCGSTVWCLLSVLFVVLFVRVEIHPKCRDDGLR